MLNESNSSTKLLPNQVQIKRHNDEFVDLMESDETELDVSQLPTTWFGRRVKPCLKKCTGSVTWSHLKIFLIIVTVLIVVAAFTLANEEDPYANIAENLYGVSDAHPRTFPITHRMTNYVEVQLETEFLHNAFNNITYWITLQGRSLSNLTNVSNWNPVVTLTLEQETLTYLNVKRLLDLSAVNTTENPIYYDQYQLELATDSNASIGVLFTFSVLPNVVKYEVAMALAILVLLYVLIIFELVHRALAAMICAFIALGVNSQLHARHTFGTVVSLIDFETIGLLFGMMIMVGIFSKTGFFEWAGVKAFKYSGGAW